MEDESGSLFNIDVDLHGESIDEPIKVPRDFQSEEDFQLERKDWTPKTEVGEVWKSLKLPVNKPSKPQAQMILHAIEELYFFRRYQEAKIITDVVLEEELSPEFRKTILDYKKRCESKL